MKKFEVIEGGKSEGVIDISEVRQLENRLEEVESKLSYAGLITFAYHFSRLKNTRKAQELLEKIPGSYYQNGIYKDLSLALMCWSLYKNSDDKKEQLYQDAAFFLILKNGVSHFKALKFKSKPFMMMFYREFIDNLKYVYGEKK